MQHSQQLEFGWATPRWPVEPWAAEKILPALKHLVESKLTDFGPLKAAGKELPFNLVGSWEMLLQELQQERVRLERVYSQQGLFGVLLRKLSAGWFLARGLLLARGPEGESEGTKRPSAELVDVGLARVFKTYRYVFCDATVQVLLFEPIPPWRKRLSCYYDGILDLVLVDPREVNANARFTWELGKGPKERRTEFREALTGNSVDPRIPVVLEPAARALVSPYDDVEAYLRDVRDRTLYEELRHAIDGKRVKCDEDWACPVAVYWAAFAEKALSRHGRMWALWQDCGPERRPGMGLIIAELTAQVTAAATSGNPRIMLHDWWVHQLRHQHGLLQSPVWAAHECASVYAIRLLAEELGLLTPPTGVRAWLRSDLRQLTIEVAPRKMTDLAEKVFAAPVERVRLALQAVYDREFLLGKVDEAPFPRIRPDGTLEVRRLETARSAT